MSRLYTNEAILQINEEVIIWGITIYKKQSDLIDISIFEEELKEIYKVRRPLKERIRRWRRTHRVPEPVWILIGLYIGSLVGRFI